MTARFTRTTRVPADIDTVFDLSLTIEVHVASFSKSQERAVDGVTTGMMKLDEEVTWKARHFGRMWTMRSRISELDKPKRFVDQQVTGPFASWHHVHRFTRLGEHVTEMVDEIVLKAPLGILGWIAERIGLVWYMARLIDVRNEAIVEMAGDRTAEAPTPADPDRTASQAAVDEESAAQGRTSESAVMPPERETGSAA